MFRAKSTTPPTNIAGQANPISDKSVAVLPFENLSDEKSNAYFADGIQDEILTRLSKIASLKVISRTSTQKYKSTPENLRTIAQQLGVANILEGSVQKARDQVRVKISQMHRHNRGTFSKQLRRFGLPMSKALSCNDVARPFYSLTKVRTIHIV